MLSLQSLRFRASAGALDPGVLMVLVETSTRAMRCRLRWLPALLLVAVPICVLWASQLNLDLSWPTWTLSRSHQPSTCWSVLQKATGSDRLEPLW